MPEYIERENAYKLIKEQKEKETGMYSKGRNVGLNIAKGIIHDKERCPTADVVKVVRCWECKCCDLCYPAKAIGEEAIEGYYCNMFKQYRKPNDFCSYGELKELGK